MRKSYPILLISILLSSCMAIQTSSDFDKSIDFLALRTYGYYDEGIAKLNLNSLDKSRVIAAVEIGLKNKGFIKAAHPDMLVNILVVNKERNKSNNGALVGGYVYDYTASEYRWTNSLWSPTVNVKQTSESTMIIDFIDPITKNLIWHGRFNGFNFDDFRRREERMYSAVKQILDQYPPNSTTNR